MIALRKLTNLSTDGRLRKGAELLRIFEREIRRGRSFDAYYLAGLCDLIYKSDTDESIRLAAHELKQRLHAAGLSLAAAADTGIGRGCGTLFALLRNWMGIPPAEWDFHPDAEKPVETSPRQALPLDLYLEELRSPFNVGSLFRSAEAFGVRRIYLSPATPTPVQPRARRSAMGTVDTIPWHITSLTEAIADSSGESPDHRIIALETGGSAIGSFSFPAAGLLLLGNEEWGLSREALDLATDRLTIPMGGSKASLNVAVAAGIALQRWHETLAPYRCSARSISG